jgi:hypothetical protein
MSRRRHEITARALRLMHFVRGQLKVVAVGPGGDGRRNPGMLAIFDARSKNRPGFTSFETMRD